MKIIDNIINLNAIFFYQNFQKILKSLEKLNENLRSQTLKFRIILIVEVKKMKQHEAWQ